MRDRGELVAIVSMDLSKAFDVIQHNLLLAKLKAFNKLTSGFHAPVLLLIMNFVIALSK